MTFNLEEFLPYRLFEAAEIASESFSNLYKERFGLSRPEWRALFNIGQHGPISGTDISKQSTLDKTSISRAIAKFEERGWVERIYNKKNRRTHLLALTSQGHQIFAELTQLAANYQSELEKFLGTDQIEKMIENLQRIEAFCNHSLE